MLHFFGTAYARCGCGEIGIRGGLKIRWGFPRCRFDSDQPHHFFKRIQKRPESLRAQALTLLYIMFSRPACTVKKFHERHPPPKVALKKKAAHTTEPPSEGRLSESKITTPVPSWVQDWVVRPGSPGFGVGEPFSTCADTEIVW